MKRVDVDKADYVRSHFKNPSGRGSWAFAFDDERNPAKFFWAHNVTYGDAVLVAKTEARRLGKAVVRVQP